MRIFIGIPFPDSFKSYINEKQNEFKSYTQKGKWTNSNNLHLTLLFIGEMDKDHVEHLNKHLSHDLSKEKSFSIVTSSLSSFIKKEGKVLWVGVNEGNEALESLAKKVIKSVRRADIDFKSSPFTPHITIARNVMTDHLDRLMLHEFNPHKILVDHVNLYLSHQIEGSLTYTPLYTYRLN